MTKDEKIAELEAEIMELRELLDAFSIDRSKADALLERPCRAKLEGDEIA